MPRPRNVKKYWLSKGGLLTTTSGNIIVRDAQEISKHRYYKIKSERKHQLAATEEKEAKIASEVAKNGCYIDEEDNIYI